MLQATNQLGIEVFVLYWEFAYGIERVREFFGDRETRGLFTGDFVAHNVADISWGPPGDPVFHPYTITEVGGIKVGIIGQAFPYTAISHLQRFVPNLTFGIQADRLLWRLLAYRLPDAVVAPRRRSAYEVARKQGRTPTKAYLQGLQYGWDITKVSQAV